MEIESSKLRNWLLSIKGIGEETADSILLYALDRPIFVVDAYTKRIFLRHNLINKDADYKEIQSLVEETLPNDTNILGEFHALLVKVGKNFCKKKNPICRECPIFIFPT
ncbi:Endonuclease III [subsurface metagenome]